MLSHLNYFTLHCALRYFPLLKQKRNKNDNNNNNENENKTDFNFIKNGKIMHQQTSNQH